MRGYDGQYLYAYADCPRLLKYTYCRKCDVYYYWPIGSIVHLIYSSFVFETHEESPKSNFLI